MSRYQIDLLLSENVTVFFVDILNTLGMVLKTNDAPFHLKE